MRNIVRRSLGTICVFIVMAFVSLGHGVAFDVGTSDAAASSAGLPSGQTSTASATEVGHTRAPGPEVRVKWEHGKLSLDSEGVPLSEVLQAVSHATGTEVVGGDRLSNRIFIHLAGLDLVQALKELLSGLDYVIAAGPTDSDSAQATRVVIVGTTAGSRPGAVEQVADAVPDAAQQERQNPVTEEAATTTSDVDQASNPPQADATPQESQLAAVETAAASDDVQTLRNALLNVDPAVQATAFQSLSDESPATAVDDLLASIQDTNQPTRLQSLQLLVQSGTADDQTVMAVLGDALKDPDPAFVAYAVQQLAGFGNAAAIDALSDAFEGADQPTKLMIMNSVANTEAGGSLLVEALSDPDATVSNAAETVLTQVGPDD